MEAFFYDQTGSIIYVLRKQFIRIIKNMNQLKNK